MTELAQRHQQENPAEKAEVPWSCCENEYRNIPIRCVLRQVQGTRRKGRQKKSLVDTVKQDCEEMDLKFYDAIQMTQNRQVWKKSVEELLTRVDSTSPGH